MPHSSVKTGVPLAQQVTRSHSCEPFTSHLEKHWSSEKISRNPRISFLHPRLQVLYNDGSDAISSASEANPFLGHVPNGKGSHTSETFTAVSRKPCRLFRPSADTLLLNLGTYPGCCMGRHFGGGFGVKQTVTTVKLSPVFRIRASAINSLEQRSGSLCS